MWKKIITDERLLKQVHDKIRQIAVSIEEIESDDCSIICGNPGAVLFQCYYSKNQSVSSNSCETKLQRVFDYFQCADNLNFSCGIAGILFVLDHLEKENFFDFEDNVGCFDHGIWGHFIEHEKTLDFLHGSPGVINSLLEQRIESRYDYLFDMWLQAIENKKEASDSELKWKNSFQNYNGEPDQGYYYGLAHGVPAIIIVLLKLYARTKSEKTYDYLVKSINFLIVSRQEEPSNFCFPNVKADKLSVEGSLSWCYGDLGCAYAMFFYAKTFKDAKIEQLALDIFTKHALKERPEKNNIVDADFCHGSVGIAHFYARMFNHTSIELFRKTAEIWYEITLQKAVYPNGIAGYKHAQGPNKPSTNEFGLLEGVSGIGLSLISAISDIEPKWDGALLFS